MSIDVVVVLPCVPATATDRAWAQIDASIPARRSVGMPRSRAARSSMFVAGMAVEAVTASHPATTAAVVADVDGDARRPDPVEHRLLAQVAARHRVAHLGEDDGDRRSCPARRRRRRAGAAGRRGRAEACEQGRSVTVTRR